MIMMMSCNPKAIRGLQLDKNADIHIPGFISSDTGTALQYRCKIDAYGQKLSGVLIVKNSLQQTRMLMITDFGLKVIDIVFEAGGAYEFKYIMKHLDYPFIRKSFAFNLANLMKPEPIYHPQVFHRGDGTLIYDASHKYLYFLEDDNQLKRLEYYKNGRKLMMEMSTDNAGELRIHEYKPSMTILIKLIDNVK